MSMIAFAVLIPIAAQEEVPPELKSLRSDLQEKLAELQQPLADFDSKYRGHLEKQKTSYQEQGDLKAMLAVEEEIKTFASREDDPLSTFPELSRLQQIYREQRAAKETAIASSTVSLIEGFRKRAEGLASEWTKEGRIEAAKMALSEEERLAGLLRLETDAVKAAEGRRPVVPIEEREFVGDEPGEEMENGEGIKLCWIPAGRFTMGSPRDEPKREADKESQVRVKISNGFWMGKYEVTQAQYSEIMGENPARFTGNGGQGPVEKVNWEEAVSFCEKLTERERKIGKLPEGWAYVLPTEAQWEYAARAGERGAYVGGDLDEVGWYNENSAGTTHPVGKKEANDWGLHDVHGNVREWCSDWIIDTMVGGDDPKGPESGSMRANRGGHWYFGSGEARLAHRTGHMPKARWDSLGFRVACVGPTLESSKTD